MQYVWNFFGENVAELVEGEGAVWEAGVGGGVPPPTQTRLSCSKKKKERNFDLKIAAAGKTRNGAGEDPVTPTHSIL